MTDLIKIINSTNREFALSSKQLDSLKKLEATNALVVIGGQQVHLFGGPAMVFYKACSLITRAKKFELENNIPCVPIFWLQNEDHDLSEVNQINLPTSAGLKHFALSAAPDSRISLNSVLLGDDIETLIRNVESELAHFAHANEIISLLNKHYRPRVSYSRAFAGLMLELFSKQGLLVFDPNAQGVKELAKGLFKKAFQEHSKIETLLQKNSANSQVHIRHNSPLFFVHPGGKDKPRYRIELDEGGWLCIGSGKVLRDEEVVELVENHPEQISTSALLRPLMQNLLFKNNIFVGGESELNYLKQIERLYDFFEIPKSKEQTLRLSHTERDEKIEKLLLELDLTQSDFSEDASIAKNRLLEKLKSTADARVFKETFEHELDSLLKKLEEKVILADKTLSAPLEKTKAGIKNSSRKLFEKYEKAVQSKDRLSLDRLEKVQNYLFPNGKPQERVLAGIYFLAKHGREYLDKLPPPSFV